METLSHKGRGCLAVIIIGLIAAGTFIAWVFWPGCISQFNYSRISVGMDREEVTHILGSPGEQTEYVPSIAQHVHRENSPPDWRQVVWGDTFVQWKDGYREIYIGFSKGAVTSKYYWEPSF